LAGQFRTDGNDVRVWTFGAALGMQYLLKIAPGRVRPFVGAALGSRAALTETTPAAALQSRETFTPSLTLGADAGLRYTLSPLVSLFLEIGVVHGWLVPGVHRAPYEERAANSDSIHASFGVVFEI
jgi:outer membrane protein W